jgi:hypothetical protein
MNILFGMTSLPIRLLTPFPHRPSRRLRNSLRSDILAARQGQVPSKANDVAKLRRWGIQGDMSPWSQDALKRPRRGGRERREIGATVGRGNAEQFPLQSARRRLNLQWSLRPFRIGVFNRSPHILHPPNLSYFISWVWKCI